MPLELALLGAGGPSGHPFVYPTFPAGRVQSLQGYAGSFTGASVPSTNSTPTDAWNDQIGTFNATQGTTAAMPTWLASANSSAQSGYTSGQSFDGTDDYLQHTAPFSSTTQTLIITVRFNAFGCPIIGSASDYFLVATGAGGSLKIYINSVVTSSAASALLVAGNWVTIGIRRNGATVDWAINSTVAASLTTSTSAGTTAFAPIYIGAYSSPLFFGGSPGESIAQIDWWNSVLSTADFATAMSAHRTLFKIW